MRRLIALTAAAALALGVVGVTLADGGSKRSFQASLNGYQETPAAISTVGTGKLSLKLNKAGTEIAYTLTYSGLEGVTVSAAHIHFGAPATTGGVVAFLCGGGGPEAPCPPAAGGTVTGVIMPTEIQAVPAQGIEGGATSFPEVLRAMRAGVTYANVHTATYPTGEIRGLIRGGGGDDD